MPSHREVSELRPRPRKALSNESHAPATQDRLDEFTQPQPAAYAASHWRRRTAYALQAIEQEAAQPGAVNLQTTDVCLLVEVAAAALVADDTSLGTA